MNMREYPIVHLDTN